MALSCHSRAARFVYDGGANVVLVPLDVTLDEYVTEAVRRVRARTDRLDVLINNAGTPGNGIAPAEATVDEIQAVYDTNAYGPIRVTHAFLPLLRVAEHPRVVMVSSAGGSFTIVTDPEQPFSKIHELAYSSSKAALNMLTAPVQFDEQLLRTVLLPAVAPGDVFCSVPALLPLPEIPGATAFAAEVAADGSVLGSLLQRAAAGELTARVAGTVPLERAGDAPQSAFAGGIRGRWIVQPFPDL